MSRRFRSAKASGPESSEASPGPPAVIEVAGGAPIPDEPDDRAVTARVYGQPTTFGTEPWWSSKGWWKASADAEANDVQAHVGTLGPIAIAGVSVRGNKHRLRGEPNQDSFGVTVHRHDDTESEHQGEEFAIVAISDGMGSAEHSHYSARMVAHHTLVMLRQEGKRHSFPDFIRTITTYEKEFLQELTRRTLEYRTHEFEAPGVSSTHLPLDSLQCTLTFAVVPRRPEADGTRRAFLGFVGDSPAFRLADGGWQPIEPAKDHEGLWSSSTQGVLGATAMVTTELSLGPRDALLLSSDGVGNFLMFNGAPTLLGHDLARRWERPVGLHDYIRDVSFELQSADDDRTAAMVWFCDEQ